MNLWPPGCAGFHDLAHKWKQIFASARKIFRDPAINSKVIITYLRSKYCEVFPQLCTTRALYCHEPHASVFQRTIQRKRKVLAGIATVYGPLKIITQYYSQPPWQSLNHDLFLAQFLNVNTSYDQHYNHVSQCICENGACWTTHMTPAPLIS